MERVERCCFFSCSLKDLKRRPCDIDSWLFRTVWTNYEKAPYTWVFLKFFPNSLNMERPWAFTILGSLNPRDRTIDSTFMSFSGSITKYEKTTFWSTVPCLSSFIKMKDQKKRRGFTHMFFCSSSSSCLQTWHPFRISVKWVGYPLPPSHDYSHWVYTSLTGYSSGHPWRLVSVSSSQCCQVTLSDMPISLKIVFPEAY